MHLASPWRPITRPSCSRVGQRWRDMGASLRNLPLWWLQCGGLHAAMRAMAAPFAVRRNTTASSARICRGC